MGFQTTEQFTVADSLLVWAFHFLTTHFWFFFVSSITIYLSRGRGIESLSTVLIDIRTSNTLWPQEGRTGCSVSGTWDKGAHLSHSWRLTLLRVRLHLRCTTDVCSLNTPFMEALVLFISSVGSPLPSNQPRPSVYVLRGWVTSALGDFVTFRYVFLFTRYIR